MNVLSPPPETTCATQTSGHAPPVPHPVLTLPLYLTQRTKQSCNRAQRILGTPLKHWDDPTFIHAPLTTLSTIAWDLYRPPTDPYSPQVKTWSITQRRLLLRLRSCILSTNHQLTITKQNYYHSTNQMGPLCRLTNPKHLGPPLPEIYSLIPASTYGEPPTRPRAITTYARLQATADVHNKQMHPPPGNPLFFADLTYDDAGTSGITLHPTRTFTEHDLEAYSPGCTTNLSRDKLVKIIDAHKNMAHLFRAKESHPALTWPFTYVHPHSPAPEYITTIRTAIRSIPNKIRHRQFSVNIFARLPEPWFHTLTNIITLSLAMRTIPQPAHHMSRIPIPKPGTDTERRPITAAEDLACLLSALISNALSSGLEKAQSYPPPRKGIQKMHLM